MFTGQGHTREVGSGMSHVRDGAMVGPGCVEGDTSTQLIWFLDRLWILGDGQGHWGDLAHSV